MPPVFDRLLALPSLRTRSVLVLGLLLLAVLPLSLVSGSLLLQNLARADADAKLQAYQRAVDSSEVAYRGAVRTQEAGLATTADVLDARARLYGAQRDLSQARYDYLLSRLRLLASAGSAVDEVVTDIDRQLPMPAKP
jgi:hypothetical protein